MGSFYASPARRIGFAVAWPLACFQCGGLRQVLAVPLAVKPASFSRVVSPPQSSFISTPTRGLSTPGTTCQGFFPLRGITEGIQLRGRHPTVHLFRPQAFSAFRRFAPPSAPQACSIPRPRPGFAVQGFLHPRSHPPSSGGASPLPLNRRLLPARAGATVDASRLRGLAPRGDAFLGKTGLAVPSLAPLFSFHLPQALSLLAVGPVPRAIRSWRYPMKSSLARSPQSSRLQRLVNEKVGLSVSRLPACSRFRAVR